MTNGTFVVKVAYLEHTSAILFGGDRHRSKTIEWEF